MNDKYVWYACYGSNVNEDRFLCYIKGGICGFNGRSYDGCTDKRDPIADKPIIIPHKLYFGNSSGAWGGGGVAFINPQWDSEQSTWGRMYLITQEQFEQIHIAEGSGPNWYGELLELGEADGYRIRTFTNAGIRPANVPSDTYLKVMAIGLKETYPHKSPAEISQYITEHLVDLAFAVGADNLYWRRQVK